MDFMSRNVHSAQAAHTNGPNTNGSVAGPGKKREYERFGKFFTAGSVALLLSIAILVGALASYFAVGNNGDESQFVNKDEYQAVFVNVNGTSGGQVYFGHIQSLTGNYVDLTNVFYIQNQSGSTQSSNNNAYTLVKLGCELHGPEDEMVINRAQVYFWENLKTSGQVSQKIAQYYKDNPNGQNCSQSSSTSATQSSTSTQNSTGTTPSSSSTTSNK